MCSVPGSEYEAREAHHLRRTLHSGDCGRRRYGNFHSIYSSCCHSHCRGQAEPLGWLSLLHFAQLYELIWLNVCIREEDWAKPQLGILFVFSSDWTLSEETSEEARLLFWSRHPRSAAAAWSWNTSRPNPLPFFCIAGRNLRCTSPLP